MAAAGNAGRGRAPQGDRTISADKYLVVIEGSIPTGAGGAYCTIGGTERDADRAARPASTRRGVIAVGTCAAFGGMPAAAPNPTRALGVADAVPGIKNLVNLPACPVNVENLTALLVYYLTFQRWPPLDAKRRPLFAYGKTHPRQLRAARALRRRAVRRGLGRRGASQRRSASSRWGARGR